MVDLCARHMSNTAMPGLQYTLGARHGASRDSPMSRIVKWSSYQRLAADKIGSYLSWKQRISERFFKAALILA